MAIDSFLLCTTRSNDDAIPSDDDDDDNDDDDGMLKFDSHLLNFQPYDFLAIGFRSHIPSQTSVH